MKRLTLVNGLLSLTAVSLMTGCTDDKYDLSDVDTTTRITVDNLTVPINLSEIKLENVVNLDDNENIQKVEIDGQECYAINKGGEIARTEFSISSVHVSAPSINPTDLSVNIPGVSEVALPSLDLPPVALPESELHDYMFKMENVDKALIQLKDVKTAQPMKVEVVLSVNPELAAGNNNISFQNLKIQLPWGLISNAPGYDSNTGLMSIDELAVDSEGKARLLIEADGLALNEKGYIENGELSISGEVGILGGDIKISVYNTVVPNPLKVHADYSVSSFDLASISGNIDYNMDAINIDPISLSGLPDFLDSPDTQLIIANPQILVSLVNPVGKYGLKGTGMISLTSTFKNGEENEYNSAPFTLEGENSKLAFCTPKEGYTDVAFDGLHYVLTNGESGLPSSIKVNIHDINFAGEVTDFPLGDLGSAEGSYEFNAPLGFGDGSIVIYETKVDGWGSDTLDDVNINLINVKALCTTNLPVSVQLQITPLDKNGNEIPVKEASGFFEVPAKGQDHPVYLTIESINGPITHFDGLKFRAVVMQNNANNTDALGPDLFISLKDIRVTVDGYYETDF